MTDFGRRPPAAAPNVLPKTGQTVSYRDGDDGYYEKGWEGDRFTDNGDGTITDNATGLMWPDDANGDGGNNGAEVNLNDAIDYAEGLDWKGYDNWRLPNYLELISLLDLGTDPPTINALIADAQARPLWTSTTSPENTTLAYFWWWDIWTMFYRTKSLYCNLICCRDA